MTASAVTWTLDVHVQPDTALHRAIRERLAVHTAHQDLRHATVARLVSWVVERVMPLRASLSGDHTGLFGVDVQLPRGHRRSLSLLVRTVPSRWRWRVQGEALVGRGPRAPLPTAAPAGSVGGAAAWVVEVPETVPLLPIEGAGVELVALRRANVALSQVHDFGATGAWHLAFDDPEAAEAAEPAVDDLLAFLSGTYGADGFVVDMPWGRRGAAIEGSFEATTEAPWADTIAALVARSSA